MSEPVEPDPKAPRTAAEEAPLAEPGGGTPPIVTGDAAALDPAVEPDWDEVDEDAAEPRSRGGVTMRHPFMLALVLVGSVFMFVKTWPRAEFILYHDRPADCGDLSLRPLIRQDDPASLPALDHDRYCQLTGSVQKLSILATGEPKDTTNPYKRNEGRRYYLKLDGDKVFAIIAADRRDVVEFRARRGNLLGFRVEDRGRIIDPDREPTLAATAQTLRLKFQISDDDPIRLFDTTEAPMNRWPYLLICVLMVFTALLALYGLARLVRRRVRAASRQPKA